MNRNRSVFLAVLLMLAAAVCASAGPQIPSVKQQEAPYFAGLGFALKSVDEFVPAELRVTIIQLRNLENSQQTPASFKAVFELGAEKYPVKIIQPDLSAFEADIMDPQAKGKELSAPIGHITLGLIKVTERKSVATGTLLIRTGDEKTSGEFKLLLNELPVGLPGGIPGGAPSDSGVPSGSGN